MSYVQVILNSIDTTRSGPSFLSAIAKVHTVYPHEECLRPRNRILDECEVP
jgi:hypothetical protein